jgi:integrase/recombinase XerD
VQSRLFVTFTCYSVRMKTRARDQSAEAPAKARVRNRPRPPTARARSSLSLDRAIDQFLAHLRVARNLAPSSIEAYGRDLAEFAEVMARRFRRTPAAAAVGQDDVLAHLVFLTKRRISIRSQARRLSALRGLYSFLAEMELVQADPTEEIAAPAAGRKLPTVLTVTEVETLLAVPDRRTPAGARDAALLELLYASGLRVSEAASLRVGDLNLQAGYLVAYGKGRKERLVPFHDRARQALQAYLDGPRATILEGGPRRRSKRARRPPTTALFLSRMGRAMSRQACWEVVAAAARGAGIRKVISPHSFRHAFGTHLLDGGADLRTLQELLGHRDISTTQVYLHTSKARVKDVHRKYHPRG